MKTHLIAAAALLMPSLALAQTATPPAEAAFTLAVDEAFNPCLSANGATPPEAVVRVKRGPLADTLTINIVGVKPGLTFDLFTLQRSNLDAAGAPVAGFAGFGLATFVSALQSDSDGSIHATLKTILLDQAFSFDTDKQTDGKTALLAPTNTFHLGFWFDSPTAAQACGFNPATPSPFNGKHMAGPLAMVTTPDAKTGLGPLCTQPAAATTPGAPQTCNP